MRVLQILWAPVQAVLLLKVRRPSLNRVFMVLSVLGGAAFCFLLGAATMHFQLPTSQYWRNLFFSAEALQKPAHGADASFESPIRNGVNVDHPDRTDDGFTLYATTAGPAATLIDMRGNTVHHWSMPFRQVWPHLQHVQFPANEKQIHWFGCRLCADGDLLAVYHGEGDALYGYGLVKLDKDSRLVWAYDGPVHHDFDVGEDGTIYALTQTFERTGKPPAGMEYIDPPYIADSLTIISPEGKQLDSIPLLEAFRDSPYATTLAMMLTHAVSADDPRIPMKPLMPPLTMPQPIPPDPKMPAGPPMRGPGKDMVDFVPKMSFMRRGDCLHPNGVSVLRPSLAAKFPMFRAGQVLVSLRNIDTLAVIDVKKRTVVWAAQGMWRRQHSPQFLTNGHILLYDNLGGVVQSRVLEFDPATLATPWSYSNENSRSYLAVFRGVTQRLRNGNTLIVNPEKCRIFEVTPEKELVWESFCMQPGDDEQAKTVLSAFITTARRYRADELTFLQGGTRARR